MSHSRTIPSWIRPCHRAVRRFDPRERGDRVVSAATVTKRCFKLRDAPADLILLEILMPGRNGYQICRAIKEDDALRALPVIFLSTKSQPSDRFWAKRVGADRFVAKPFDPAELLREIHSVLQPAGPAVTSGAKRRTGKA